MRRVKKMKDNLVYQNVYDTCKRHLHSYVLIETTDGFKTDGILTGLDDKNVYLAVPIGEQKGLEKKNKKPNVMQQFNHRPNFPPRRFRRIIIPLALLATLTLLPWY